MSFRENPPNQYVPWRPNKQFINFFEQMKKRRVPATENDTMKVTNVSPPGGSGVNGGKGPRGRKTKANYSTPSEVLVNTAHARTGLRINSAKSSAAGKRSSTVRKRTSKKAGSKRATPKFESKIRKHRF